MSHYCFSPAPSLKKKQEGHLTLIYATSAFLCYFLSLLHPICDWGTVSSLWGNEEFHIGHRWVDERVARRRVEFEGQVLSCQTRALGCLHVRRAAACTYNPAAPIRSHVTVYLQLLAELSIEKDGVNSAQSVSIHQMLGAVLRMSKHSALCIRKEAISRQCPSPYCAKSCLEQRRL